MGPRFSIMMLMSGFLLSACGHYSYFDLVNTGQDTLTACFTKVVTKNAGFLRTHIYTVSNTGEQYRVTTVYTDFLEAWLSVQKGTYYKTEFPYATWNSVDSAFFNKQFKHAYRAVAVDYTKDKLKVLIEMPPNATIRLGHNRDRGLLLWEASDGYDDPPCEWDSIEVKNGAFEEVSISKADFDSLKPMTRQGCGDCVRELFYQFHVGSRSDTMETEQQNQPNEK